MNEYPDNHDEMMTDEYPKQEGCGCVTITLVLLIAAIALLAIVCNP